MTRQHLELSKAKTYRDTRARTATSFLLAIALLVSLQPFGLEGRDGPSLPRIKISKKAAESCSKKVISLQDYAAKTESSQRRRNTRFSEEEINSYLALELSPKYHSSLKSILISLEEGRLQGKATIDFDQLAMSSGKVVTKIIARLFSGVHDLTLRGKLVSGDGKANLQLEEARFDEGVLPNVLVEEIITAVGRKQKPPFDPMQPSQMPYRIERVELHRGYIVVCQ